MDTCGEGIEMSKQKSYADTTVDRINEAAEKYGWQSEITENRIQAQIAINLALISDCLIEIYRSERRREIDMDKFIFGEEIGKETEDERNNECAN